MERILIEPFGPSIFKTTIPKNILDLLNEYTDKISKDELKSLALDYGNNLVGNVNQEFKLEVNFMKSSGWALFLFNEFNAWISSLNKFPKLKEMKITKFQIKESWIVRQYENDYNPVHSHSGHISGVGYLKIPSDFGKPTQLVKGVNNNGKIQFIHGSRQFLSHSVWDIDPKVGDFYLFPNYLMHTVYPFVNKTEERRSISFNAFIDDEFYNSLNF